MAMHFYVSLDESMLRQFGVSYGFKVTLMDIIETLVCDIIPLFMHNYYNYESIDCVHYSNCDLLT
jgi:hypothetical protein